ncbi:SET2 [Candida pseudojiufengensis]|uniref:SET2 n=1 Tax=Candida pseudojiufengensis TaxID=497109 RepID=UPI00222542EE|nr:SET2 [Candida pseudojiufengensis]KAI5966906.1 SET2 [Candida pseudojiufengensis]
MNGVKTNGDYTPQLYLDAEDKTEEALSKFEELEACTYKRKDLGSSSKINPNDKKPKRKTEYITCDCEEEWDSELQKNLACGEHSNCINRITSVECTNKHCLCGEDCQNQRFQKREYADVSVFQTELKGYGLRANSTINEGQFIYEYIGEVIDEPTFRNKMVEYDVKQYKHFYFMMLKTDSFIDATEKGSLARFVNHSCNPNAFVDKWVVGDKLRMGIFSKRKIIPGEEITFDYNVDRYGAQSQPCYCGEPNCLKFMGGKTQTDAALLLPEGFAEALGVTSRIEKAWLKENKHLRSKYQKDDSTINEMFIQSLEIQPMQEYDVSKVMAALMKAQQQSIIQKLIGRMELTEDSYINSLMVKFHGHKTLAGILQETNDEELITSILNILSKWPAKTKNKISSSQIEDVLKEIQSITSNEDIKDLIQELLDKWSVLEIAYRIPKGQSTDNSLMASYGRVSRSPEHQPNNDYQYQSSDLQNNDNQLDSHNNVDQPEIYDGYRLPRNWKSTFDNNSRKYYFYNTQTKETTWDLPFGSIPVRPKLPIGPSADQNLQQQQQQQQQQIQQNKSKFELEIARREEERIQEERKLKAQELIDRELQLKALIELAKSTQVEETKEKSKSNGHHRSSDHKKRDKHKDRKKEHSSSHKKSSHSSHSSSSSSSKPKKEVSLEQQWKHVLAKHVPNLIKSFESQIGKDNVKGCAKDLVNTLATKEIKQNNEINSVPKELDKHKLKKIKQYSNSYMEKFLIKYKTKKENKRKANGGSVDSNSNTNANTNTNTSYDDVDDENDTYEPETVEKHDFKKQKIE